MGIPTTEDATLSNERRGWYAGRVSHPCGKEQGALIALGSRLSPAIVPLWNASPWCRAAGPARRVRVRASRTPSGPASRQNPPLARAHSRSRHRGGGTDQPPRWWVRVTRWRSAAAAILVAVALPGCQADEPEPAVANPASTYCEEQGGTLEIREDAEGNQVGWCVSTTAPSARSGRTTGADANPGGSGPARSAAPVRRPGLPAPSAVVTRPSCVRTHGRSVTGSRGCRQAGRGCGPLGGTSADRCGGRHLRRSGRRAHGAAPEAR
jgi:putative hemolysin